jgi:hypothetical protein
LLIVKKLKTYWLWSRTVWLLHCRSCCHCHIAICHTCCCRCNCNLTCYAIIVLSNCWKAFNLEFPSFLTYCTPAAPVVDTAITVSSRAIVELPEAHYNQWWQCGTALYLEPLKTVLKQWQAYYLANSMSPPQELWIEIMTCLIQPCPAGTPARPSI